VSDHRGDRRTPLQIADELTRERPEQHGVCVAKTRQVGAWIEELVAKVAGSEIALAVEPAWLHANNLDTSQMMPPTRGDGRVIPGAKSRNQPCARIIPAQSVETEAEEGDLGIESFVGAATEQKLEAAPTGEERSEGQEHQVRQAAG
jgi:hypothetical protein